MDNEEDAIKAWIDPVGQDIPIFALHFDCDHEGKQLAFRLASTNPLRIRTDNITASVEYPAHPGALLETLYDMMFQPVERATKMNVTTPHIGLCTKCALELARAFCKGLSCPDGDEDDNNQLTAVISAPSGEHQDRFLVLTSSNDRQLRL